MGCNGEAFLTGQVAKIIQPRRAGPETGKVKSQQTQKLGIVCDILGGKIKFRGNGPAPCGAWPILAEEGPLVLQLQRMAVGKAHAVAGGEEQGGSFSVSQPELQILL